MTVIAKSDVEQVKVTMNRLVDSIFIDRDLPGAYDQFFYTSQLPVALSKALEEIGIDEEVQVSLDAKTKRKIFPAMWNYTYQPAILMLGTETLSTPKESVASFHKASQLLEDGRATFLRTHGLSSEDFYSALDRVTNKGDDVSLRTLESVTQNQEERIRQSIDQDLYMKNILRMKKSMVIKRHSLHRRILFEVQFEPFFRVILFKDNKKLKVVSFGDLL